MKGNNSLELNHETMVEAVQLWLDKHFQPPAPMARSVKIEKDSSSYGNQATFTVLVQAPEPKAEA